MEEHRDDPLLQGLLPPRFGDPEGHHGAFLLATAPSFAPPPHREPFAVEIDEWAPRQRPRVEPLRLPMTRSPKRPRRSIGTRPVFFLTQDSSVVTIFAFKTGFPAFKNKSLKRLIGQDSLDKDFAAKKKEELAENHRKYLARRKK